MSPARDFQTLGPVAPTASWAGRSSSRRVSRSALPMAATAASSSGAASGSRCRVPCPCALHCRLPWPARRRTRATAARPDLSPQRARGVHRAAIRRWPPVERSVPRRRRRYRSHATTMWSRSDRRYREREQRSRWRSSRHPRPLRSRRRAAHRVLRRLRWRCPGSIEGWSAGRRPTPGSVVVRLLGHRILDCAGGLGGFLRNCLRRVLCH